MDTGTPDRSDKEVLQHIKQRSGARKEGDVHASGGGRNIEGLLAVFDRVQQGEIELKRDVASIREHPGLTANEYMSVVRIGLTQRGFLGIEVGLDADTVYIRRKTAQGVPNGDGAENQGGNGLVKADRKDVGAPEQATEETKDTTEVDSCIETQTESIVVEETEFHNNEETRIVNDVVNKEPEATIDEGANAEPAITIDGAVSLSETATIEAGANVKEPVVVPV